MKLQQLGELQLLSEVRKRFNPLSEQKGSGVIVGIGDDAAVFSCPEEKILVTTDMMNEGVHFDLNYTSPYQLGFKLVSVNVSDIFAMGGRPRYIFLNTAMQKDVNEDFFRDFFDGISSAMNIYGLSLLGGDISSAVKDITVSATVIGVAEKIITRAGAKPGDRIYLTGTTGDSACGLEILKRLMPAERDIIKTYSFGIKGNIRKLQTGLRLNINSASRTIAFDVAEPLIKRHLMPVARHPGHFTNNATSMIDISDGLFIDLSRICDESNVGAKVYLDRIPLLYQMKQAAEIIGVDPYSLASSGGEDYELLFTVPAEIEGIAGRKEIDLSPLSSNPAVITCIGEITTKERVVIALDGSESQLMAEGYQHFGTQR